MVRTAFRAAKGRRENNGISPLRSVPHRRFKAPSPSISPSLTVRVISLTLSLILSLSLSLSLSL